MNDKVEERMKELFSREMIPAAGEQYRHFKGRLYQIIGLATDSRTEETMVVYQALYGEYRWYVRSLTEFLSPVDREKYPAVTQQYRFERVRSSAEIYPVCGAKADKPHLENADTDTEKHQKETEAAPVSLEPDKSRTARAGSVQSEEEQVRPELLLFLDAESATDKLRVLHELRKKMDEELLTTIELSMDLMPDERESMERRLDLVERTLEKRIKYEGGRLR